LNTSDPPLIQYRSGTLDQYSIGAESLASDPVPAVPRRILMTTAIELLKVFAEFAWPLVVLSLIVIFWRPLHTLIDAAIARVQGGSELKIGILTLGQAVGQLCVPLPTEGLTDDNLALIHRSWRSERHDFQFGKPMHRIHIILFGPPEALKRVEYVVYRMDKAYPKPIQIGGSLNTNFELNELANGYSLIRAEAYVRGQVEPVGLSRFIDLTDQSPRLKGSYQKIA
jgi:hypothetical protein